MDADELISKSGDELNYKLLLEYINAQKWGEISTKELDKLLDAYGANLLEMMNFDFLKLYSIVSARESNKALKRWTRVTGFFTIVIAILTIYTVLTH